LGLFILKCPGGEELEIMPWTKAGEDALISPLNGKAYRARGAKGSIAAQAMETASSLKRGRGWSRESLREGKRRRKCSTNGSLDSKRNREGSRHRTDLGRGTSRPCLREGEGVRIDDKGELEKRRAQRGGRELDKCPNKLYGFVQKAGLNGRGRKIIELGRRTG